MGESVWRAQPKQAAFLARTEDQVLYGGAKGGGKTDALLIDGILTCTNFPGSNTLFLRRTFRDLDQVGAAIQRSHQLLKGVALWDGQTFRWNFPNGSRFQFGHLQHADSIYQYQGAQADILLFDEVTQFTEDQYSYVTASVRATVEGVKPKVRAATNPGGVGHMWVKKRWIDKGNWGEGFTDPAGWTGCFVPAKVTDNKVLLDRDPEYLRRLQALPEGQRRLLLEGDWDVFAGQAFAEWLWTKHVVAPFEIPAEWPRWIGLDWGYHAPMCAIWVARNPDTGDHYAYKELYGSGWTDVQQAIKVRAMSEGETIRARFADPTMWNKQGNGQSIAGAYATRRVVLVPANAERVNGWQRLHEYLAWDEDRGPKLKVFANCSNLIRTLPALIYDEAKPEEVDSRGDDHAADALRFAIMGGTRVGQRTRQMDFEVSAA
jgi:phage terminase large subunit